MRRRDGEALRDHIEGRAKDLGLKNVRINNAGCLDRCELGPTMVIYPEGVWYSCPTKADIDEVLETHVLKGRPRRAADAQDRGQAAGGSGEVALLLPRGSAF